MKNKIIHWFVIGTFVMLYLFVSVISTIHVVDFFKLSNPTWLAISLAFAFELGAAASLAAIIVLEKTNKVMVWILFFLLTFMQSMGNSYYAYVHLHDYNGWIELFGLIEEEIITQKRILAIISGAILPIVALGFIKSLVDYIKPDSTTINNQPIKPDEYTVIEDEIDKLKDKSETDKTKIKEKIKNKIEEIIEKKNAEVIDTSAQKTNDIIPIETVDSIIVNTVTEPPVELIKEPAAPAPAPPVAPIKKPAAEIKPKPVIIPHYKGGAT